MTSLQFRPPQELAKTRDAALAGRASFASTASERYYDHEETVARCDLDQYCRELHDLLNSPTSPIETPNWRQMATRLEEQITQKRALITTIQSRRLDVQYRTSMESLHSRHEKQARERAELQFLQEKQARERAEQAWIELLLDHFDRPAGRDKSKQSIFRQSLIEAHNSWDAERFELWCPVLRQHGPQGHRRAAHIVGHKLGQKRLQDIFGLQSLGELYSVRNGLILDSEVARYFDNHEIAFVPETPIASAQPIKDWRVRVMDGNIRDRHVSGKASPKWKEIDGRQLSFLSPARPAARYVYFHFVIALLRSRRHNRNRRPDGWTCSEMWATPGKWVRKSMLEALARAVGHEMVEKTGVLEIGVIEDEQAASVDQTRLAEALITGELNSGEDDDDDDGSDDGDEDTGRVTQ